MRSLIGGIVVQNWTAPPPPRPKFYSPNDVIHLEDERGRVTLVGERLREEIEKPGGGLVTGQSLRRCPLRNKTDTLYPLGVVVAALGMETASGDFEVIDICYAGLPPLAAPASDPSNQIPEKSLEKKPAVKGKGKAKQEPVKKAPEPEKKVEKTRMDVDGEEDAKADTEPKWVALISGVSAGSAEVPEDLKTILLLEWLTGEGGGMEVSLLLNSLCNLN